MRSKSHKVKAHFDNAQYYLSDNANIRIRAEVDKEFIGQKRFYEMIDIGCGSAEISMPHVTSDSRLTLLDVSENMLAVASRRIPPEFEKVVTIINEPFSNVALKKKFYDLVICTGLLAHLEKPFIDLEKMLSLLKVGGTLILQNTDSRHAYSYLNLAYVYLQSRLDKNRYIFNQISERQLLTFLRGKGFVLANRYRYVQSFLFFHRFLPPEVKYRLIKKIFGNPKNNRRGHLGNEMIYHFIKIEQTD